MGKLLPDNKQFMKILTIAAIVLTIIVALLASYLLIVGQKWTGYYAQSPEDIAQGVQPTEIISYETYYPAIFPLASSVMLLIGIIRRKNLIVLAWAGLIFLLIFSALFLFSSGAGFLPIAALILAFLVAITIFQRKETRQLEAI